MAVAQVEQVTPAVVTPDASTQEEEYTVIGTRPIRPDGTDRAPGAPAAAIAAETVVDELCEQLHIDPLEFRLLNGAHEGTRQVAGPRFPRIGYLETVQAAKDHPHYTAPLEGPYRGRGVASGYWHNSTGPASVISASLQMAR